jgi:hypothetical protein
MRSILIGRGGTRLVPLSSNSDVQKALNHALRVTATEVNEEPEERRETI